MLTRVVAVDAAEPDVQVLRLAGAVIRDGGLVAFPTETVYGLGADAMNANAVEAIYAAKGRPADNPVIVHVADRDMVGAVASTWPARAKVLAEAFWPGPLTIVCLRQDRVPDVVTAGGPTVAVRMPCHAVALGLVTAAGTPVAAPSANASGRLSPTRAAHVLKQLDGRIDMVLDGGAALGGLESTVVDLSGGFVRLLRPGLITSEMLRTALGEEILGATDDPGPARSPGLMTRHYAPDTRLVVVRSVDDAVDRLRSGGVRAAVVAHCEAPADVEPGSWFALPSDPCGYAARLYDTLHRLDDMGLECVLVIEPPQNQAWDAVRDRLMRARAEG